VSTDQPVVAPPPRFYYGWVVVAVAFVTMAIGVNVRTGFSLLFPPILAEFGWNRGDTAGAFSVGFVTSAALAPPLGYAMDRWGPRWVVPVGSLLVSVGLVLATYTTRPWHLYLTLGVLVVGSTVILTYTGHAMFLPHWFVRRRGLAIGIAFSGVGVGSILIFPWMQSIIVAAGWRQACWMLAVLMLVVVLPLNLLLQRRRPEELGLLPDGDGRIAPARSTPGAPARAPAAENWPFRRAMLSAPFWWLVVADFAAMVAWYTVQVHQTKYLTEIGISPTAAAFALGLVGLMSIAGQIGLGHFADRVSTEWAWTLGGLGFAACYAVLLALEHYPSTWLVYVMVAVQGGLGYGIASVFGSIPAQIFQGRAYARIFGMLSLSISLGAGLGPWLGGALQDRYGSYAPAFWVGLTASGIAIAGVWFAAPSKGPVR
jgi:MFS family permease